MQNACNHNIEKSGVQSEDMNYVQPAKSERITLDCENKLLMTHQFLRICSMNSTHFKHRVTAEDILHLNTIERGKGTSC
jgi:hypothetical protein